MSNGVSERTTRFARSNGIGVRKERNPLTTSAYSSVPSACQPTPHLNISIVYKIQAVYCLFFPS